MRHLLVIGLIAAAPAAHAQPQQGGSGRDPRPARNSTINDTDVPFRGGLGDTRTSPFGDPADQITCLERKRDGQTVCHKRAEWERIAAEPPATH